MTDLADPLPDDPGTLKTMLTVRTGTSANTNRARRDSRGLMPECPASDRPWHWGQTLEIWRIR
jgi:hypothetical protein